MKRSWARIGAVLVILLTGGLLVVPRRAGADQAVPGRIAFVRKGNVWEWSNGTAQRLFGEGNAVDPRWSSDGQAILYVRMGDTYSDLVVHYLQSNEDVNLTNNRPQSDPGSQQYANDSVWALDPAWSPSGVIAFVSDNYTPSSILTLWVMPSLGDTPRIAPGADTGDNLEGVSLTSDGSIAAYTERITGQDGVFHTVVVVRDLYTGEERTLVDAAGGAFDPAFGPSGQNIAVTIGAGSDNTDIWLVDRATGNRTQITHDGRDEGPTWSPDGRWLAYLHATDGGFEIWAMPINGTAAGPAQKLAEYDDLDATSGLSWTFAGG